jgi:hypothetical protein
LEGKDGEREGLREGEGFHRKPSTGQFASMFTLKEIIFII